MAALLAFALATSIPPSPACAKADSSMTALELQEELEKTKADYSNATRESEKAAEMVEEQEKKIKEVQDLIPEQKNRSAKATREIYKLHQQSASVVTMLLDSESFDEFVNGMEYVSRVNDSNYAEIARLDDLQEELSAKNEELKRAKEEADARMRDAKSALDAVKAAQDEAKRREEENERIAAEAAARAQQLIESPRNNDEGKPESTPSDNVDKNDGSNGNGGDTKSEGSAAPSDSTSEEPADSPEDAFIAKWTPRINAFLAGSPMSGTGRTFAQAAYRYNVDPRVSPAIAMNESSRGAVCFRPHNAWGWGNYSWGSWDEAINAHVSGFSRCYGYTLTMDGAYRYWDASSAATSYNNVMSYMNMI